MYTWRIVKPAKAREAAPDLPNDYGALIHQVGQAFGGEDYLAISRDALFYSPPTNGGELLDP